MCLQYSESVLGVYKIDTEYRADIWHPYKCTNKYAYYLCNMFYNCDSLIQTLIMQNLAIQLVEIGTQCAQCIVQRFC